MHWTQRVTGRTSNPGEVGAVPAPDGVVAFPVLGPAQVGLFDAVGCRIQVERGDWLYKQGDEVNDFYVLVSGTVNITAGSELGEVIIGRPGPGMFLGELNHLSELRVMASAQAAEPGELIQVGRDALRRVLAVNPRTAECILSAFMTRRTMLLGQARSSVRVVGSRFSPETQLIRELLARSRVPHEWLEPERDLSVEALMSPLAISANDLPAVVIGGVVLRRATAGLVAEYLGLTQRRVSTKCYDLAVVGGGPAGLAAAVYGASEGLKTLCLEASAVGGQAGRSSLIENYLGFPTGISGPELTYRATVQAEKFGASLTNPCPVASICEEAGHLVLRLSDGTEVSARAVIAATGARYRRLNVERLEHFESRGVYYAATDLEARMCVGQPVIVVGAGNSAGQAAVFLADGGCDVTLLVRGDELGKTMSQYLAARVEAHKDIHTRLNSRLAALHGDQTIESASIRGPEDYSAFPCKAIFSFIGAEPASGWLSGYAAIDNNGFVVTDRTLGFDRLGSPWTELGRPPLPYETSHPGLFAVGDVRSGSTKRVASAVGEGSAAVRSVHDYLGFVN